MQNYPGAGDAQEEIKESAAVAIIRQQPNDLKKCYKCENSHNERGSDEKNIGNGCTGAYRQGKCIVCESRGSIHKASKAS